MALDSFKQIITTGDTIGARMQHKTVVHRGNLYTLMGYNGSARLGDMFFSNNARSWRRVVSLRDTHNNTITARESFGLVEHNEKVYLMGGYDGSNHLRDVYVSGDMFRWKRLNDGPWSARYGFVVLSFDQRIWVLGGIAAGVYLNDVWWTRDGMTWTHETNAPWTARVYHAGITYNNMMYIIGGLNTATRYNDVWYTTNGRNWVNMETDANFSGVDGHAVTSFGDGAVRSRMILTGGQTGTGAYSEELWHSGEGNNWYLGDDAIPMGDLRGHTMTYFDGRLIVIGGIHGAATYRNEIWESQTNMFKVS